MTVQKTPVNNMTP